MQELKLLVRSRSPFRGISLSMAAKMPQTFGGLLAVDPWKVSD
jgi:hypothetical protein